MPGTDIPRRLFVRAMASARIRRKFRLIACVVMPEHIHIIILRPDGAPLAPIVAGIKTGVAKHCIGRWTELRARILDRLRDGHATPTTAALLAAGTRLLWARGQRTSTPNQHHLLRAASEQKVVARLGMRRRLAGRCATCHASEPTHLPLAGR